MGGSLGVGMVGYAFMGAAHSQAWRTAGRVLRPAAAAGHGRALRARRGRRRAAAARSWAGGRSRRTGSSCSSRDDVGLVDVCTPGDTPRRDRHRRAGRGQARAVREAAGQHGRRGARDGRRGRAGPGGRGAQHGRVQLPAGARGGAGPAAGGRGADRAGAARARAVPAGLDRRPGVPAGVAAAGGEGGVRARWATSARTSSTWRSSSSATGSPGVSALTETFVKERPLPAAASGLSASGGTERGPVTVDDAALFLGRFDGGAVASFEATRFATGRKNAIRLEVNGSAGSLAFDFESMNELSFYDGAEDPRDRGLPAHPGHRADPPVRGRLVAAGAPARLRALVHPRGGGPDHRPGRGPRPDPVVRRRPAGAAGAGRRRAVGGGGQRLAARRYRRGGSSAWHDRSPCSPASGPTCRSRRWPGSRASGATTGWRSPAGAITSTRGPRSRTTPTSPGAARSWPSTASRSTRSPTTSPGRPSATTRSTSGTRPSCRRASGATASRKACGSAPPRPCR